jgi:two-component system sensor histidine kinase RegB
MWVSYSITALVVATFLVRIAAALRRDEQVLATEREKSINNEHILRIGTLAAGAAHELSSPLGSIAMLIDEMRHEHSDHPEIGQSLDMVAGQLASCRATLTTLLSYGNNAITSRVEKLPFDQFVRHCVTAFAERRPDSHVALRIESGGTAPRVLANKGLCQALTSLLDNAADVSPQSVEVRLGWDQEWLRISVCDRGPGFPPEIADHLGKLFFTTKGPGKGNGLGLYLANSTVVRFGGTLTLANIEGGGAVVQIVLPVSQMSALDMDLRPQE